MSLPASAPTIIMLPIEAVTIPLNRQRTMDEGVVKHIEELSLDIAKDGLLHAVAITASKELVAGWCRLHAVQRIKKSYKYASADIAPGFIPCVVLHHTEENDLFRVELMENLRRRALSPMDQAKAVAALHRLLQNERGPDWTKADTGHELEKLRGEVLPEQKRTEITADREVADSLLLEGFMDDAEVNKAPSRKEAVRIAKKKMETALLESAGALASPNLHTDFNVIQGNCIDLLPAISDNSYAGIICDPPYGVGADTFGEQTSVEGHEYRDTPDAAFKVAECVFREGFRVCQQGAHLYMFCDPRMWPHLEACASTLGWNVYSTPLIWHKPGLGHAPQPGYFSRRYECILFAQKGLTRKLQKTRSDVLEFPAVKNKVHAAEKPVELLRELMQLSFFPGERILDPCCGSGTSFIAGYEAKVQVSGIEISEKWYQISRQTISELK